MVATQSERVPESPIGGCKPATTNTHAEPLAQLSEAQLRGPPGSVDGPGSDGRPMGARLPEELVPPRVVVSGACPSASGLYIAESDLGQGVMRGNRFRAILGFLGCRPIGPVRFSPFFSGPFCYF